VSDLAQAFKARVEAVSEAHGISRDTFEMLDRAGFGPPPAERGTSLKGGRGVRLRAAERFAG
jgi:hypothetical protein